MEIRILAVGKLDDPALKQLCTEYMQRIRRLVPISVHQVSEPGGKFANQQEVVHRYSRELRKKLIPGLPYTVCDVQGRQLGSKQFAHYLQKGLETPPGQLQLVVGGSAGLDQELLLGAQLRLSFSTLTFPHQLFRVLLLEQIYRGMTIVRGLAYHK